VHLLLRAQHKPWRLQDILGQVQVHEVDVADAPALDRHVASAKPDWVFHLAAHGAYPTQQDLDQMLKTNLQGTANLVRAAVRAGSVRAFVSTGSSSEYGYKDHAPAEDEALEPNSDYAVTKAAATLYCNFTAARTGLPITTLRLYSVYGPYEEPGRLVPTLIVKGLQGELPPLVNPKVARDYVHVDDVSDAYLLAAANAKPGAGVVYNVGTGVQTTLAEIVAAARKLLRIDAEPSWGSMPERAWDTNVWVSNPARIKRELGWAPKRDLEAGLRQTIDWFKVHPDQLDHYRGVKR
jgi:nucleoside-diphosphate-sugar epimerase